jgi:hypothetical protein
MRAFQPQRIPEFAALQTCCRILRRHSSGAIDANVTNRAAETPVAGFARSVVDLRSGSWQWLNFQNNQWIPFSTESSLQYSKAVPRILASGRKRSRLVTLIAILLPLLALLYFFGGFLLAGFDDYQALAKIIEDVPAAEDISNPYVLSTAQALIRSEYGAPESFSILFYQEEQMDGSFEDTRAETWTYYSSGMEFTFINGELEGSDEITHELEGVAPTVYVPEQFTAGMSLEQVASTAELNTYLYVPLDSELVDEGRLYYAPQLTWGFKKNVLTFVRGLALVEGGGNESAADDAFDPARVRLPGCRFLQPCRQ